MLLRVNPRCRLCRSTLPRLMRLTAEVIMLRPLVVVQVILLMGVLLQSSLIEACCLEVVWLQRLKKLAVDVRGLRLMSRA